jgi:NADPH-dependent glutamate synthase beta subunit-like oxidoreductase
VLGRTCDRPCEPACRRGRIEEKPVAICRLKRVAADHKGDIEHLMPSITPKKWSACSVYWWRPCLVNCCAGFNSAWI